MAQNPIVWWEPATHDAEQSVAIFRQVFGWPLEFDESAGFIVEAPFEIGSGLW